MAMNPRLLRPTQGGFSSPDADARAYLAAVRIADGANLEPAVAKAISDFVIGCKTDGIWDAIKASCILAGARTLAGALTPLKGAAPTNNGPFVSGDYNRETGLKGNASTKYLNSGRKANADSLNDCHLATYASEAATGFMMYMGGESGNAHDFFRNGAVISLRNRGGSGTLSSAGASTGLIGHTRSASGSFVARASGTDTTITAASGTADNADVFIFARNNAGSLNLPSDARLAFYSIGSSVNLALLDTRVSALITAIGAAI
jgi:hypothetical protein